MASLFDSNSLPLSREPLEEGAVLLRGFATTDAPMLVEEVERIAQAAEFRHLVTPGGYTMSVAMTNCGRVGCRCGGRVLKLRSRRLPDQPLCRWRQTQSPSGP
jgi:alkylated DNA repair dioxygenase AlkB